ncbi:MAG: dockerin type I domain-containing protein [Clostridiales bacterium]|jgi:M6 family metalloprotease-like protein|nr:dockerin type I domain-containing protein [Clostridiales bacterium]
MFKKLFLVSMVLMLSAVFCSHLALAGTASPFPAPFTQPDGTIIVIRLCGDEFLNWTEDYDGNLIVFDSSQGGYCYAGWSGSDCISTGELVGVGFSGIAPKPRAQGHSIPENLLQRARQERAEKMPALSGKEVPLWELNIGDEPDRTDVSYLKRRVLIIHVTWEDRSTIVDRNRVDPIPKMTGEQIYDLVFNPAARSVNDYYKKLIGTADEVILPAAVKTPMDGYQGIIEVKLPGRHPNTGIIELREMILINAITFACANGLIDLSSFDTNGDGVLQTTELAIGFIVDGREASVNSDPIYDGDPRFWGVSSSNVPDASNTNGVRIESYFGQGAFHRATGMPYWDNLTIGIICHELGHAGYKFVDTYDYTYSSNGHGYWSLMAQGGWGRKGFDREGTSPGYPDAYNLTKAGCPFVIPGEIIDGKSYSLDNHLDIYAARPKGEDKQYFLLQQRKFGASADNYDQGAFTGMNSASNQNDGGLLIYHIDHNVSLYRINDKAGHYLAGIEEAHGGIQNLQNTADEKNYGDPGDLWGISKKEFSGTSDPTSGLYSPFTNDNIAPDQNKPSGITIFAITWDSVSETTAFNTELKDPRCYIEEFSIPGSLGSAVIDQIAGTISVQMPPGTDLTNLTPTVKFTGQSVTPAGGIARDFTDPLVYTVTAESGDTRQYLVTVRIRAVSDGLNISDLYLPRAENLGNSLERFIYYGKYNGETDKSRLWQVVGLEDQSLVLMQRHNYEDRRYHSEHTSALFWGQSEIYKYLNNIDSPPEAFTGFFTNGELDSIRKTDVKTIAFDLDSRTCVQVDQQGSSDTLFYLPSLGDNESQLTWSATLADYQDKILLDDMIYGSHNNRYWLRSLMLGIISNYYRLPYLASAPLPYYATMATEHCYVRPLFKLIPSDLVFMAQIGGSGIGAIAADANYLAGTGEGRNFKLTVLGGNDGADVGALSGVPGGTVTADLKEGCTLTGLIANPLGMGNFTINYKIVEERDGIRSIAGYGSSTNLTALNIDTAGLRENESYTVYVWLQKNNEIQSHEATLPQYFTLKTNSAVTGGSLRGKIKSYNPGNQTTVQLIKDGTVVCGTAIPASAGWDWDAPEQEFILVDLLPGTYDLVISKKAHTQFTVSRIIAGYGDLDLTLDSRPEIQLMTLRCGDINGDGNIDSNDLVILLANFDRCADATNYACDLNGDGLINNLDLTILWRAYNYDQGEIVIDYSKPAGIPLAGPARKADLDDIILENSPGLVDLIAFGEGQITGYGKNGKFLAPISAPDPGAIKIYTAEDLNNIRNNLSGSYVLMNDIDLASFNGGQWVPIGYHLNYFSGVFDGQGYEIKNLTVTDATHECAGLFGDANGAIIKNVGINGANIYHPPTAYAGGVCGWIEDGSIVNCYNDGSISAY